MRPAIYLAGPEVFLPHAAGIGRRKQALCEAAGCEGLFPFDEAAHATPPARRDRLIYAANIRMIARACIGIFNLTPFRGPSADPGTVFELGMMAGLGKPCFGYTNVADDMRCRIPGAACGPDGVWRDADGFLVEDFGNADNLMLDACLAASGSGIVRCDADGRLDDLSGFARCLEMARSSIPS